MKTKSNNKNQNTTKTEPSAEDKALAELVRTNVLELIHGMKKVCKNNGLSFDISGWVEDPVNRGESPKKTLTFKCGKGGVCAMITHKIIDLYAMLQDCTKKCSHEEAISLATLVGNLVSYGCKNVMTKLNKKKETKEK